MALASDDPDIIFTGELRKARLAETVRNAGLFSLPSLIEGLPLALLEAMNEGIPVLTSNIPVHQRLVGSDRGQLFQMNDLTHLIRQLQWSLEHLPDMQRSAQRAQKYIQQHHSWDKIADELLDVYRTGADAQIAAKPSNQSLDMESSSSLVN